MVQYDPKFLENHAKELYKQSQSVQTCHFFIGMFAGLLVFYKISYILMNDFDFLIVAIGTFMGAVMGFHSGRSKAYEMRLEAQQALCQVELEKNSREHIKGHKENTGA